MKQLFVEGKLYVLQPTNNIWAVNSANSLYVELEKWYGKASMLTFSVNSTIMCLDTSEKHIKYNIRFLFGSKHIKIGCSYYDLERQLDCFEKDWKLL